MSEIRQALTRARFLTALENVELTRAQKPSSVSTLVELALPTFRASSISSVDPSEWDATTARGMLQQSPTLAAGIADWLTEKNLNVPWMCDIALFTLAAVNRRPDTFWWRLPSVGRARGQPSEFRLEARGWDPEYESLGAARRRIRTVFATALEAHLAPLTSLTKESGIERAKKNERRDLEWVAVHQVYGWSVSRIAKSWGLGNRNPSGNTGRANVARTIDRWRRVIGLP